MIRIEHAFRIPEDYANAIQCAQQALVNNSLSNIWNHDLLREKLPAEVASTLIECQRHIKRKLIEAVGPYCTYCHVYLKNSNRFELDHFVLKSHTSGTGKYTYQIENILLCCKYCNDEKSSKITFDIQSVSSAQRYTDLVFTCYHPNVHDLHQNFDLLTRSVVAKTSEAKAFLVLIDYADLRTNEKIMSNFEIRNQNNKELEDQVRLISSITRERSLAV